MAYVENIGFLEVSLYPGGAAHHVPRTALDHLAPVCRFLNRVRNTNRRYRYLLDQGTTGLSIAFDLPTQIGYDSDHPMAAGEVGKSGWPLIHWLTWNSLFDRIPLDKVSTSMTINAPCCHTPCHVCGCG